MAPDITGLAALAAVGHGVVGHIAGRMRDFYAADLERQPKTKALMMAIPKFRWLLPCAVVLGMGVVLLQLGWEHTHGGIQRHHFLNDASMPAISNVWGLVVLPLLGALAGGVVVRRADRRAGAIIPAMAGFLGSVGAGAALAVAFATHGEPAATQVALAILIASALCPVYRAEYLFGFVMGMTFVFGPVLPALVASLPMLISALSRWVVWPAATWVVRRSVAAG
ncbi:MAG: hypothetical protein ABW178_05600 [Pseudoxanthomonas sp.]